MRISRSLPLLIVALLVQGVACSTDRSGSWMPASNTASSGGESSSETSSGSSGGSGSASGSGSGSGAESPSSSGATMQDGGSGSASDASSSSSSGSSSGSSGGNCGMSSGMRGLTMQTAKVGSANRTYLMYLPKSLSPTRPAAFVYVFHGHTMSGQEMYDITGYSAL